MKFYFNKWCSVITGANPKVHIRIFVPMQPNSKFHRHIPPRQLPCNRLGLA